MSEWFFQSLIYSLLIHWTNTTYIPLWWPWSLTEGKVLITDPSCCSLQSIATFLAKAILPHAVPRHLLSVTRIPREWHYWGIHDFGQLWPKNPLMALLNLSELHDSLRCFHPASLLSLSPLPEVRLASRSNISPSLLVPSLFSLPEISLTSPLQCLPVLVSALQRTRTIPTSTCLAPLQEVREIRQWTRKISLLLSTKTLF